MDAELEEIIHLNTDEMFKFAQKHADFSGGHCDENGMCCYSVFGINGETGDSFMMHVEGKSSIDALSTIHETLPVGSNCSVYPGRLPLNVCIMQD